MKDFDERIKAIRRELGDAVEMRNKGKRSLAIGSLLFVKNMTEGLIVDLSQEGEEGEKGK